MCVGRPPPARSTAHCSPLTPLPPPPHPSQVFDLVDLGRYVPWREAAFLHSHRLRVAAGARGAQITLGEHHVGVRALPGSEGGGAPETAFYTVGRDRDLSKMWQAAVDSPVAAAADVLYVRFDFPAQGRLCLPGRSSGASRSLLRASEVTCANAGTLGNPLPAAMAELALAGLRPCKFLPDEEVPETARHAGTAESGMKFALREGAGTPHKGTGDCHARRRREAGAGARGSRSGRLAAAAAREALGAAARDGSVAAALAAVSDREDERVWAAAHLAARFRQPANARASAVPVMAPVVAAPSGSTPLPGGGAFRQGRMGDVLRGAERWRAGFRKAVAGGGAS